MASPYNKIPLKITQLQEDPSPSDQGWMAYVNNGQTYKVQVSAVLNVSGVPTSRQILTTGGLTGGGDLSTNRTLSIATGGVGYDQLAVSGVTSGTYGSTTQIPVVTVDDKGRVTAMTTVGIPSGDYVPTTRQVIAGNGLTGGGALSADVTLAVDLAGSDIPWTEVSGGIATPDYVQFNTNPSDLPADQAGLMYWNTTDGAQTLNLVMDGANVVQQIGEELFYRIKASADILNGQVVMFSGAVGLSGQLQGAPAFGLGPTQGNYIMGIATEDIPNNEWGYVTAFGLVRGVDTTGGSENWQQGDVLYWDPTSSGLLTNVRPDAPNVRAEMAAVITVNANNGELLVRVTAGSVFGQTDSNVQFGTLADGDIIQYDSVDQRWENQPVGSTSGIQPYDANLTEIAALTPLDAYVIMGDGVSWTAISQTEITDGGNF